MIGFAGTVFLFIFTGSYKNKKSREFVEFADKNSSRAGASAFALTGLDFFISGFVGRCPTLLLIAPLALSP